MFVQFSKGYFNISIDSDFNENKHAVPCAYRGTCMLFAKVSTWSKVSLKMNIETSNLI